MGCLWHEITKEKDFFMSLENLLEMSHRYGKNEEYVLAGGGNTSYKENGVLYVKGSGTELSNLTAKQLVSMDMKLLLDMINLDYPDSMSDSEKDEKTLAAMMAAKLPGEEAKRPSVESNLHAIFPYKYVLHLHPAMINGMTCGLTGKEICTELFGEKVVWIDLVKPGLILAQTCNRILNEHMKKTGSYPQIVILQNHGIFAAADTVAEIDELMEYVVNIIKGQVRETPDFNSPGDTFDMGLKLSIESALKALYPCDREAEAAQCFNVIFCNNKQVSIIVKNKEAFKPVSKPFTPDHIVYCKDEPLFIEQNADVTQLIDAYTKRKGYKPNIIAVRGMGFFAAGETRKKAEQALALFMDAMKIATYAKSFGGVNPLSDEFTDFILNWEIEAYRAKV